MAQIPIPREWLYLRPSASSAVKDSPVSSVLPAGSWSIPQSDRPVGLIRVHPCPSVVKTLLWTFKNSVVSACIHIRDHSRSSRLKTPRPPFVSFVVNHPRSKLRSRFYRRPQRSRRTLRVLGALVVNQIRDHSHHSRATIRIRALPCASSGQ